MHASDAAAQSVRICSYEDRPSAMDALIFMAESLCRVDSAVSLHLTVPEATPAVRAWAQRRPEVVLTTRRPDGVRGWDVKPWLLLQELRAGRREALWLDADMIVTRPVSSILADFLPESLIVAEEWNLPGAVRLTPLWGLPTARAVVPVNSCFIRVTQAHRQLLERWLQMTREPRYREAQALPFERRPFYLTSDQALLTALLGSQEFGELSFDYIRIGRHIAQCAGSSGYRPRDRALDLFRGLPPLIHCIGRKPWESSHKSLMNDLVTDVSPYVLAARRVARDLDLCPEWLEARTSAGAALRAVTAGHPGMAGLPLAILHASLIKIKEALGLAGSKVENFEGDARQPIPARADVMEPRKGTFLVSTVASVTTRAAQAPGTTETTAAAAAAAGAVLAIALCLGWMIRALQAPLQQQTERAVLLTGVLLGAILITVPGVYLLRMRANARPEVLGIVVLSTLAMLLLAVYFFWVGWYVFFPADIWIWSEGDFVNDIMKFATGYPLYSAPANHDSYTYVPGAQLLTYFIAWPLGKVGSIPFYRLIQLGYTAAAAFVATLSCRLILRLARPRIARSSAMVMERFLLRGMLSDGHEFHHQQVHPQPSWRCPGAVGEYDRLLPAPAVHRDAQPAPSVGHGVAGSPRISSEAEPVDLGCLVCRILGGVGRLVETSGALRDGGGSAVRGRNCDLLRHLGLPVLLLDLLPVGPPCGFPVAEFSARAGYLGVLCGRPAGRLGSAAGQETRCADRRMADFHRTHLRGDLHERHRLDVESHRPWEPSCRRMVPGRAGLDLEWRDSIR